MSYIQKRIFSFNLSDIQKRISSFKDSLFDYHSYLNHKGCIVRDERKDEKRYITRDKLIKKNIKININFPPKKRRTAVSKLSYTLIKIKRITFFTNKGSLLKRKNI